MNMPSSEINNLDIPTLINLKTKVTVNDIFELLQKTHHLALTQQNLP